MTIYRVNTVTVHFNTHQLIKQKGAHEKNYTAKLTKVESCLAQLPQQQYFLHVSEEPEQPTPAGAANK